MGKTLVLKSIQSVSIQKKDVSTASLIKRDISPVALILGNQPVNTIAPVITGIAQRGETLSSTTGTWTGTGTITFAYQWQRDNVDISGATSSTYVLVAADDNTSITCVVSATDSEGTGTATSNAISPILGVPYNLVAPVASGTGQVGQTLSTTNGSWQGVATITFTYQWRRDASDISGATSSTYTLVADDYATDIDCVVTATNSLGSANQDSNDIANIAGSVPVISGVPTISGLAKVGETLTATAASVTGTPTPTDTFQWQRSDNGSTGWANVSGATNTTYTAVSADEGKFLRVVQTSTNEAGSDTANSASTTQVAAAFTGLLDTYTDATAAYSLRLLRSGYTGSAIRVRRADDNAEQDIGFRNNDLDTSTLETFSLGSDCFVTTWYDQSGNGKNTTQSTASNQPKIVSNGSTITEGTKPTLTFSGSNGLLNESEFVSGSNDRAIISVAKMTSQGGYIYGFGVDSNFARVSLRTLTSYRLEIKGAGEQTNINTGNHDLLFLYLDGTTFGDFALSVNSGTAYEFTGTATLNTQDGLLIGARNTNYTLTYDGTLQELIVYDSSQVSNKSGIETNINDHYSIY